MATGNISKYADGTDSGWKTLTLDSAMASGSIIYRKLGALVEVRIDAVKFSNNVTDSNAHIIATMPSGYRPINLNHYFYIGYDNKVPWLGSVRYANGTIACWKPSSESTWNSSWGLYGAIVYLAD